MCVMFSCKPRIMQSFKTQRENPTGHNPNLHWGNPTGLYCIPCRNGAHWGATWSKEISLPLPKKCHGSTMGFSDLHV